MDTILKLHQGRSILPAYVGGTRIRLWVALLLCLPASLPAQTSFPMVWSAFPAGVERGKTTEVTVYAGGSEGGGGENVYGAYKALFEGTGVTAVIMPPEKGWPARDPKKPIEVPVVKEVKMRVTVAADAPIGIREFRLGTPRHGISTVGQLVIGDEPEVVAQETNSDPAHAQAVTLPCVANGRLDPAEKTDHYKFHVSAGQTVVFTALCARLEDKIHDLNVHADPLLILRDPAGSELARNDDYYGADSLLSYRFDKAGEYAIEIRDTGYRGNPQWVYRLTMTTRPYVTRLFPCAVRPGRSNELHAAGFNLGNTKTIHLDVPADAPAGIWTTQLKLPGGMSNVISLLVSDLPQSNVTDTVAVTGQPKGSVLAAAVHPAAKGGAPPPTPLKLPGGVNAWLRSEWQVDRYTFHVKKGEMWGFEVTARRLGSTMDSELRLRDAGGNVLDTNDDAFGKDSRLDWTAPEDGDYTLEVRGVDGNSGPDCYYNLAARSLTPEFRLRCDTDRAMIAPGNRTAWYVLVDRKYGFAGDVKVEVKGLPGGVTAEPLTIPAALTQGTLFLVAAPDAHIDTALVQVTGTATLTENGKPVMVHSLAHPLTEIYVPGGGRGLTEVQTQGVAVTEANDVEVTAGTRKITLAPGGSVKIEVTVKRRADYTKPITLDLLVQNQGTVYANPLPTGITVDDAASKTLLNDKETQGYITLRAAADAPAIQDVPIAVLANVSINFVMKVWYASLPITLTVASPPAPSK